MNDSSPRLRRPAGFIFDLDGTLVDSFADIAAALNDTRADFGLPPVSIDEVKRRVGNGSQFLVRSLVPVAEDRFGAAYEGYLRHYEQHLLECTQLLPGVAQVLAHFAERPLAVVTNKAQRFSEAILRTLGVYERFRIVLGGDAVEHRKPHPGPIRAALEGMAVPSEAAVMVGDGTQDMAAGKAAGVLTVGVLTGVEPREVLAANGADVILERMDALLSLFD